MASGNTANGNTQDGHQVGDVLIRLAVTDDLPDVDAVLGVRGSVKGCWCMFFRLTSGRFRAELGEGNRRALAGIIESGGEPGLLAYSGGTPVGWASVAPRDHFPRLDRSPISKRLDDEPVWALVCLYVSREHRGTGVARALVRGAVAHAHERGARIVEAYPVDDTMGPVAADDAYHGLVGLLRSEGFEEVARRTPKRPVMRWSPDGARGSAPGRG